MDFVRLMDKRLENNICVDSQKTKLENNLETALVIVLKIETPSR